MPTQEKPRPALLAQASRFLLLSAALAFLTQYAPAVPDRRAPEGPAKTLVRIIVPTKVPSFDNRQLEVALHAYDPRNPGNETLIDMRIDKGFRHRDGVQTTTIDVTLGASASVNPALHYYVTVAVFDAAGKRTHLGERDGKRGVARVLTDGRPNQVAMIVRAATVTDAVMDIADEIKKGNNAKVAKMAQARAKDFEELVDAEELYKTRARRGMGWGTTDNVQGQDGIEVKLRTLARGVPANFAQDAQNNEEAAYWIAALAELAAVKPDFKEVGKRTRADWAKKASNLRAEADGFAKAIATKDPATIQRSATAVVNACAACHAVYKD